MNMCFHFPIDMCTCVHVYTCRPGPWSSRFLFIKKPAGDSLYLNKSGENDPAAWLRTITFKGLRDMGTWEALDGFSGQEHRSTSGDIICSISNAHMIHAPAPRVRLLIRESAAAWKLFCVARQRHAPSTRGASYSADTNAYELTFEGLRSVFHR